MLAQQAIWQTGPGGTLTADVGEFRLVVRRDDRRNQLIRFLVVRRAAESDGLVGSGTEADVCTAMNAAIRAAGRLAVPIPEHSEAPE